MPDLAKYLFGGWQEGESGETSRTGPLPLSPVGVGALPGHRRPERREEWNQDLEKQRQDLRSWRLFLPASERPAEGNQSKLKTLRQIPFPVFFGCCGTLAEWLDLSEPQLSRLQGGEDTHPARQTWKLDRGARKMPRVAAARTQEKTGAEPPGLLPKCQPSSPPLLTRLCHSLSSGRLQWQVFSSSDSGFAL